MMTRPMSARPRLQIGGAVLAATMALTLASCAPAQPEQPSWPVIDHSSGDDLPAGSVLVDASQAPEAEQNPPEPLGSLRPDDRPVAARVPAIIERGRLIVGVAQSLNRLGFRDPATGDLAGFEADIAREMARDIFGDPSRIEFRYVESRQREDALDSGEVDMVIRTMSVTAERQDEVEFSLPYLKVSSRLLVQKGSGIDSTSDLANRTVCVTQDSSAANGWGLLKARRFLQTLTWSDCLMAMQRHQADAIFSDDAILTGLQAQDPTTELVGEDVRTTYYAVATAPPGAPRDTAGLAMQVNTTMERITADGTLSTLYRQWMQQYLGAPGALPRVYRTDEQSAELLQRRQAAMQRRQER